MELLNRIDLKRLGTCYAIQIQMQHIIIPCTVHQVCSEKQVYVYVYG